MLKWFSANSKNNIKDKVDTITADGTFIDNDDLQKARYRLVGAGVLFLSVLLSLPFLVKSQNYTNKTLNMKLINEQSSENGAEFPPNSSKTFKKIPMEQMDNIENIPPNDKPNLKKNNKQHIENSTNINKYYEYRA